ncbi:hypothetical protein DH2020_000502 [Rehmannia glutinosa]|uniref:Pentatricopeptide repeat-containing protein n=1 Tax=Rehmannia glutinosa TaxID=99300 RepID=A0ABR0XWT0_REHGL
MSIPAFTAAPFTIQHRSSPPLPPQSPSFRQSPADHHHRFSFKSSQNKNSDSPPEVTTASWTSSIAHHCRNGRLSQAVFQFTRMRTSGVEPNHVTFVTLLSGCAHFPSQGLLLGPSAHGLSFDHMGVKNKVSWNTIINGYMRNGEFDEAIKLFDEMPERDAVSWTVLIDGFVKKGRYEEALEWFQEMQLLGMAPDFVTIILVLSAVANLGTLGLGLWLHRHAGLVDKGLELFEAMTKVYKITPRIEHYGCIVDLYSRAGRLKDALQMFDKMPMKPNEVIVGSLLAACRDCKDVELAERLMKYIYDLDPSGDFNYVLLSNIYAATGSWRGASNVRKKMKALGVQKRPGISSIEVNGIIHEFVAGDKSHTDSESIYMMLKHLSNELRLF